MNVTDKPWWSEPDSQARVLADTEKIRDKDIVPLLDLRKRLLGPYYGGGAGDKQMESPKNNVFAFHARMHSECLGGDLKFLVEAPLGSPEEGIQLGYEDATNQAFERGGGPFALELAMQDMCCGYGAIMVSPADSSDKSIRLRDGEREQLRHPLGTQEWGGAPVTEETPITDAAPRQPKISYLPPQSWGYDRRAYTLEHSEFFYYDTTHDLVELKRKAKHRPQDGWNIEHLNMVGEQARQMAPTGKMGGESAGHEKPASRDRIMVTLRTLIVYTARIGEEKKPEHCNGVRYTIWLGGSDPGQAQWVRDPQWNFGPPFGQVALFAQFYSGEDSTPYSALTANMTKIRANEAAHATLYKRIREYKRGYLAAARDKKAIKEFEASEEDTVHFMPGLEDAAKVHEITRGGVDEQSFAAVEYLDRQLEENLAMAANDTGRTRQTTATESNNVTASSARQAVQFRIAFNKAVGQLGRIMGWYVGHDAHFVVRASHATQARLNEATARQSIEAGQAPDIGEDGVRQLGQRVAGNPAVQLLLQGGDFAKTSSYDFNELRFLVDAKLQRAKTMEEQREESVMLVQQLAQVMQLAATLPVFDWKVFVRQIERDYGRRDLMPHFKAEKASQIAQMQIEQGQPVAQVDTGSQGSGSGDATVTYLGSPQGQQGMAAANS